MARITWSLQSLEDIEAITAYISRDAPRYANIFVQRVFGAVERLKRFPASGRIVPEMESQNIREIIMGNYRIIYLIINNEVRILTVHHGSRLLDQDILGF